MSERTQRILDAIGEIAFFAFTVVPMAAFVLYLIAVLIVVMANKA